MLALWDVQMPGAAGFLRDLNTVAQELPDGATSVVAVTRGRLPLGLRKAGLELGLGAAPADDRSALRWWGSEPRVVVLSPEGVVTAESRGMVAADDLLHLVRVGLSAEAAEAQSKSVDRTPVPYPDAARWIGSPEARCVAKVAVAPDGSPHAVPEVDCDEPFATATRRALMTWSYEAVEAGSTAMVAVNFEPSEGEAGLQAPDEGCLWSASVRQDGAMTDVVSSCVSGRVLPEPLPWSEVARLDSTSVGGIAIHGVALPTACHVVVDVSGPRFVPRDAGTCPEVVGIDAMNALQSWKWSDSSEPVRVVLRFEPPT